MPVRPYNIQGSPISFNTYTPDFIGKPVQQIGNTMLSMSNANHMLVDKANKLDIALSNLDVNPVDKDYLFQQKEAFDNAIKDIANSKDFSSAQGLLNRTYKDYATNQGLKYAIKRNAEYMQQRADLQKNRDKYDPEVFNYMMNTPFTKTQADEYGFYSDYSLPQLMQKYDYSKELHKIGDNAPFITRTLPAQAIKDNNGNIIGYKEVKQKYKDINSIYKSMYDSAVSDSNTVAYANQLAQVRNSEGRYNIDKNGNPIKWRAEDIISSWIKPIAESYAGISNIENNKYDMNAYKNSGMRPNTDYISVPTQNGVFSNISKIINGSIGNSTSNLATETSNKFGYSNAYGMYSESDINNGSHPENVLKRINQNIKSSNVVEQQTINMLSNDLSKSIYGKQFIDLNNSEKVNIYSKINKLIESKTAAGDVGARENQISFKQYGVNDKATAANQLLFFTSDKSGKIKDNNNNLLLKNNIVSHKFYDLNNNKVITGAEFYKFAKGLPKNTKLSVSGETDYTSPLTLSGQDLGFSKGIVFDVSDNDKSHRFIMADNMNNVKNYYSVATSLLYNAQNSIVNGGDRPYPIGVPTVQNGKQVYMTIDNPKDNKHSNIDTATTLYFLDNNGNVIKSKNYESHAELLNAVLQNSNVINIH